MSFLWLKCNSAVLVYGANIGDGALVTPHSVIMKSERLNANSISARLKFEKATWIYPHESLKTPK
jgi:carbonic anhydrase/acetyltransferase-like protein (isoleucine patch superfamily)